MTKRAVDGVQNPFFRAPRRMCGMEHSTAIARAAARIRDAPQGPPAGYPLSVIKSLATARIRLSMNSGAYYGQPRMPDDHPQDARWMTHGELAKLRNISRASAIRLIRRHKWPKQTDNLTGVVRTLVPAFAWTPAGHPDDDLGPAPAVQPPDVTRTFEQALALLREQLEHERARSDRLETRIATTEANLEAARAAVQRAETALDRYYAAPPRPSKRAGGGGEGSGRRGVAGSKGLSQSGKNEPSVGRLGAMSGSPLPSGPCRRTTTIGI
jgi:hypothetical protein